MSSNFIISVLLSLLGSFFTAISFVLMKVAHNITKINESVYKNPYWVLGFATIIIGQVFNVLALKYGSQVLLSSTTSFTIIFNTIFSAIFLKENLQKSDFLAVVLICIGCTLSLFSAKNDEKSYT